MEFQHKGIINEITKKLLKESIVMLKWDNPALETIILHKKCPKCNNKLLFGDRWYENEKCVIFKRLCPYCKQLYILAGYFQDYNNAKDYFISKFRMNMYNEKLKNKLFPNEK